MSDFIRSSFHGTFKLANSPAWGQYLVPIKDPEGTEISESQLYGIQLIPNFPRVPAEIWARIVHLFFKFCRESSKKKRRHQGGDELEAEIVFLRKEDDLTQWRAIVPQQIVTGASVKAEFEKSCDIVTGERITEFPPAGWIHAGSAHSHNTMPAYFSRTDDEHELSVPGLHIVIGNIDKNKNTYAYKASIVLQKQRKFVKLKEVVNPEPKPIAPHKNVYDYISEEKPEIKEFSKIGPMNMEDFTKDIMTDDEKKHWLTEFFGR